MPATTKSIPGRDSGRSLRPRSWLRRRFPARGNARPEPRVNAGDAAEIGQDRLDLVRGELDLRHVAVTRAHSLGEAFLELLDRIFEIDLAERRRLGERALACGVDRVAPRAILVEDGLAVEAASSAASAPPAPVASSASETKASRKRRGFTIVAPSRKAPRDGSRYRTPWRLQQPSGLVAAAAYAARGDSACRGNSGRR